MVTEPDFYKRKNDGGYSSVNKSTEAFPKTAEILSDLAITEQAERCTECGMPLCRADGCPLENPVPEIALALSKGQWRDACEIIHSKNNFPEITGRVCCAPCESACTLSGIDKPVLIRNIERYVADRGWKEGWIKPEPAERCTGRRVAIVGSGPAGLAAAQQLVRMGHSVLVFERDDQVGGLLRYGVPDFRLDKFVLDRRVRQLSDEGVEFVTDIAVGEDISHRYLRRMCDAVCLTLGATVPKDLLVPGHNLENVHFGIDYLRQHSRLKAGKTPDNGKWITAKNKNVAVIGSGDIGNDCVETARRDGARQIYQFEILPETRTSKTENDSTKKVLTATTANEDGCLKRWCVSTKRFSGVGGKVARMHGIEVKWICSSGNWSLVELPETEFSLEVDLVILAVGFLHVGQEDLLQQIGLKFDGDIKLSTDGNYMTSEQGVFAAGDATHGVSLVAAAIRAGREAAAAIDRWLKED